MDKQYLKDSETTINEHLENHSDESIELNDNILRESLLSKLKDMTSMNCKSFCEKWGVSEKTYRRWKRNFVLYYNIDPRCLYDAAHLKPLKELLPYYDDEKYKLPVEQQLIVPVSAISSSNFFTKKRTIQIGGDGVIKQVWVKQNLSDEEFHENILNTIREICEEKLQPIPKIKAPTILNKDIMTFYPIPDLHFGMLIHGKETDHGINFDTERLKEWFEISMSYLIDNSPQSETAVIVDLGDFLHSSDDNNRTKSGHSLDVDSRHSKIVRIAFDSMRFVLEKALKKHKTVHFYSVPGNHSEYLSIYLKEFLYAWFRDNKRLIIETKYSMQQYHRFGKNILGFSHGHMLKPEKCSEVLLYDNQEILSELKYRYFHFGHFHQNKSFSSPMVKVEIHSNLPPRDFWTSSMGYRDNIGLSKSIVYHKDYGEISRNTFNLPENLKI